ncbi:MAG: EAL domain-containing protein [Acidobacteria bacterium]|nr:MAG: EAL domain-containing protein [Acidobacteriota bacterium]REK00571.1 MAG: EAL domain-containing protein [Acidobacteriota bacterium]
MSSVSDPYRSLAERPEDRLPAMDEASTPRAVVELAALREELERALSHASRTAEQMALHTIHVLVPEDRVRRGPIVENGEMHERHASFIGRLCSHAAAIVRTNDLLAIGGPRTLFLLQRGITHSHGVQRLAEVVRHRLRSHLVRHLFGEPRITVGAVVAEPGIAAEALVRESIRVADEAPSGTIHVAGSPIEDADGVIVREIQSALRNDGFFLEFQPQVDLRTGRLRAAEALVRMDSRQRGVINPTEFIAVAEDHGLMCQIGSWVLHEAVRQWDESLSRHDLLLAINVSGVQLENRHFAAEVLGELRSSKLPAERLELEITEGCSWEHSAWAANNLRTLRGEGVRIAFDDFGEGFSTLGRLGRSNCDRIKIPRALVHGIGSSRRSETIVEALLRLASDLGIATTAEGVETKTQHDWLVDSLCELGQGLFFGPPGPMRALA